MTSGAELLEARWRKLAFAGEVGWITYLLVVLAVGYVAAIFPLRNDYLTTWVDVPGALATFMRTQGIDLENDVDPALAATFMPVNNFRFVSILVMITGFMAAVRGRWFLYFAMLIAMLIPPAFFGANGDIGGAAILVGGAAVGRCVSKRDFRTAWPVAGFALLIWLVGTIADRPGSHGAFHITRDMNGDQAEKYRQIEATLQVAPKEQQAAARYVRAQIAYIHHDWQSLQAIGPVDGKSFQSTPYKQVRLRVLKRSLVALRPNAPAESLFGAHSRELRLFQEAIFIMVLGLSLFSSLLRHRIKRIGKIIEQMQTLLPLRAA